MTTLCLGRWVPHDYRSPQLTPDQPHPFLCTLAVSYTCRLNMFPKPSPALPDLCRWKARACQGLRLSCAVVRLRLHYYIKTLDLLWLSPNMPIGDMCSSCITSILPSQPCGGVGVEAAPQTNWLVRSGSNPGTAWCRRLGATRTSALVTAIATTFCFCLL